jgi:hypothetical protein
MYKGYMHHALSHNLWHCVGRAQENGTYNLPDGTQYERDSGEEFGPNGYWYRWTCLRGVSMSGKVG